MRTIGYETYKMYAKKYGIHLTFRGNGKVIKKSMNELSKEIYDYETTRNDEITYGLYYTNKNKNI